jgi:hypothetical protein
VACGSPVAAGLVIGQGLSSEVADFREALCRRCQTTVAPEPPGGWLLMGHDAGQTHSRQGAHDVAEAMDDGR